jgi:hypothetical protein
MEWLLLIGYLIVNGLWTKHLNTKNIREMVKKTNQRG